MTFFKSYRLVRDTEMWSFLKRVCNIYSAVEKDLLHVTKNEDDSIFVHIFLNPMESVYVPFVLDGFLLPEYQVSYNPNVCGAENLKKKKI